MSGFKWVVGPIVDTITSQRFGKRRTWIFAMQIGMIASVLAAMNVDFVGQLSLFTAIIFLHNAFAATMDVGREPQSSGSIDTSRLVEWSETLGAAARDRYA